MAKLTSGSPGKLVRRKNKNGDYYYQERESGKRVSRNKWENERKRISKKVSENREKKDVAVKKERDRPAFPVGVAPSGVPRRKQGEAPSAHKGLTGPRQDANIGTAENEKRSGTRKKSREIEGVPFVETPDNIKGGIVDLDYDDDFIPFEVDGEDDTG